MQQRSRFRAADGRDDGTPGRVLLVSDDAGTVAALTVNLADCLRVSAASTVSDGLRILTKSPPDLVVLDLYDQPHVDSVCFLRTVSARLPVCQIVVIAASERAYTAGELGTLPIGGFFHRPLDLDAVLGRIDSLLTLSGLPAPQRRRLSRNVMRALEYLSQHYPDGLTIGTVANAIGVSPSHLVHVFRAETGMTLRDCLARIRIEVTKFLLEHTDHKLELVAQRSGFCDASHLCRIFLRYTGRHPGKYRHESRQRGRDGGVGSTKAG